MAGPQASGSVETENRIEPTVGLMNTGRLAIGCALVLRPFFTAVCFALILVIATWPAFNRLQSVVGGRESLAALVMVTLATLVFVLPPTLVASSMDHMSLARSGCCAIFRAWDTAAPDRDFDPVGRWLRIDLGVERR